MNRLLKLAGSGLLCLLCLPVFSQQDTIHQKSDTTTHSLVYANPYFSGRSAESLGTYSATVSDQLLFHTYAGASVFNALRGNAPSVYMNPAITAVSTIGMRNNEAMTLIDGVPFSNEVFNYYNLNAFEFESVTVLGNATAAYPYGSIGIPGGFFLKSKSGENHSSPTFEFNTYTTVKLPNIDFVEEKSQWSFGNSLAFKQDFGAVDLRASANFTTNPVPANLNRSGHNRNYSFKINSGVNLGGFSARFIGDFRNSNLSFISTGAPENDGASKLLQGNLLLEYRVAPWLKVTTLNIVTDISNDNDQKYLTGSTSTESQQKRRSHNFILSINKSLPESFSVSAFTGVQGDKFSEMKTIHSDMFNSGERREIKNFSFLGGAGAEFKRLLFVDYNFRHEKYSLLPDDQAIFSSTYSFSFIPTKLLHAPPSRFNGKLRASYGSIEKNLGYDYPAFLRTLEHYQTPLSERNSYDFGFDLSFLNDRMNLSASRFNIRDHATWLRAFTPFPGPPMFTDLGELHNKGYEVALVIIPVQVEKVTLRTKMNFYKYDVIIKPKENGPPNGDPVSLGSTIPKWQGSIFSQLQYGGFFMNVLFDMKKGGDLVVFDVTGPLVVVDASIYKFRDISLGYSFRQSFLENIRLKSAHVSLSGRNLIAFQHDRGNRDPEIYYNYSEYLRSVSLSLSVSF
jgi:hypothetical protein